MMEKDAIDKKDIRKRSRLQGGNAIVMLFAAIGMAGIVTYGLNNVMRGPAATSAEISRRSIAENNLIATTRLAISAATHQQSLGGDCDGDGFVEPLQFRDSSGAGPVGGGWVPATVGASMTDPWGAQYGYCVWDPGTATVADDVADCGGAAARRLTGAPRDDQYAIAVISAGRDGAFETDCNAYADANDDGVADNPLLDKDPGSDDIVLAYTYAEANGIGGGEWKLKDGTPGTAEIGKDIEIGNASHPGGASFTGALELSGAHGLILPRDPGDDSVTGPCAAAKDGQLRLNVGDGTAVPSLEICFEDAWVTVSGGAGAGESCTADFDTWEATTAPTSNWEQISMSTDGEVILAQRGADPLLYSHDGGETWSAAALGDYVTDIDMSGDGQVAYASTANAVQKSTDGGATWSPTASGAHDWMMIDTSSDGSVVAAVTYQDRIWVSTDGGANWTEIMSVPTGDYWWDIAVSKDGTHITALQPYGLTLYVSTDGGSTFASKGGAGDWGAVAMSSDGMVQAASTLAGPIYLSTDGGNTWAPTSSGSKDWWEVAVSDDGSTIVASVSGGGSVWYSEDQGVTWAESGSGAGDWHGITISGDGSKVAVVEGGGGIHISNPVCDGGGGGGGGAVPTPAAAAEKNPHPLDTGMIGRWKMDEGTGTALADSEGDNDGAFVNTPNWTTEAPQGQSSLLFDSTTSGVGDGVLINTDFEQPTKGTIALWANLHGLDDGGGGGTDLFNLANVLILRHEAARLRFYYKYGVSYRAIPATGTEERNLLGTGWHYIVATFDDDADIFRLFVDGIAIGEATYTDAIAYDTGLTVTRLGKHVSSDSYDLIGGLDDVRLYNRALGPGEVAALYERVQGQSFLRPKYMGASPVLAKTGMVATSGYGEHTCAIKPDGSAWCWGGNNYGRLGINSSVASADAPKRVQQQSIHNFHQISAGRYSTCGVTSDGSAWCWGEDGSSQLGNGATTGNQTVPSQVAGGAVWMQISAGGQHACGIQQNGVAYCWGADTSQQLGNGAGTTAQASPVTVNGGGYYSLIRAGMDHTCGIKIDGSAWCWGLGTSGQLGNAAGTTEDEPVAVSGNLQWKDISLEATRTCGVTVEGGLWCWGTGYGNTPVRLEPGESWSDVEVGTDHLCASKTDGSLWCLGDDTRGALGNDSAASPTQAMPMRALLSAPVTSFAAGNDTSCAMLADNTLWCWGADTNGSLGNGSTSADQFLPARVAGFPAQAPWIWNPATTSFKLNGSVTIALGSDKWISPSGDASYFGFESAGKARLRQTGSSNQLLIETGAASNSAQASFARGTASPAPSDTTTGSMVAQWQFNESAGTNVPSATGSFAGTASGTYTWNTTGDRQASGGVLEFDGDTGRVSVANSGTFRPSSGSYTISVWVRPDGYQAHGATILSKSYNNGANHSYALTVTADQKVAFITTSTGPTVNALTSEVPLRPNAWTKVEASMTFSGTDITKTLRINGANEVTSGTIPGPIYSTDATGNLFFGAGGCTSPCNGFRGAVDDFRIHNAAWSADVSAQSFAAQTSFVVPKAIGIDHGTNNLEAVIQNATATDWISAISPGLSLTSSGNLGAGVAAPSMTVEAAGGVRIGYESTACSPTIEGALRYTGNVGDEPIGYSCTATNWVASAALPSMAWNGLTYANGRFMTVAANVSQTNIYTSLDGATWTSTGNTGVSAAWEGVAYGNGVWVAVGPTLGQPHVVTSSDNGVTWTPQSTPDKSWASVTFANGVFVATAISTPDAIMTSTDGVTWTPRTIASSLKIVRAAYGNGVWMAVAQDGELLRSTDNGATWVVDTSSGAGGSWNSITYGNGLFVIVATNGYTMSSPDGLTWTSRTPASMSYWISVNYLNNVFLATSNDATTMTSPDGITWTAGSMASSGVFVASAYGGGRIVAIQQGGSSNIMTSECTATSQGGSALLASALGYWKFDESSGSTAADSTGSNPGTLAGNAAFAAGKKGNALSLDGSGDYASMGSAANLDNLSALSVCSWVKAPTTQTQPAPAIVGKLNSGETEGWMVLAQSASGTADLDLSAMLSGEMKVQEDAIPDETWKHLCVTWDGTATEAGTNLYIDGVQASSLYYSGYAPEDDSDGNFRVGYLGAGSDFKGLIDEVVLFNRAITPAEVADIMQATSGDPITPKFQYCDGTDWTDFAVVGGGSGGPGYMATRKDWGMDAGGNHTCAVRVDGALSCWGEALYGQLGNGSTTPDQTAPVKIGTSSWTQITTGRNHTCGVQADGSLWCWGSAYAGRLGNGSTTPDQTAPVKIGTSSWTRIAGGSAHTCGVQADGSLWCWGYNITGQLGNGTAGSDVSAPVKIGTSSWVQIAAGDYHSCGIQADGSLWCWGRDDNGQIGNGGTTGNQTAPVKIGTSSWVQIAAGEVHTCGIQADGSLWCWGAAADGRLGNGSTTPDQTAPVKIGTSSWVQITTGDHYSCGIQADGSLWCWGNASDGALGNGSTSPDETAPVKIGTSSWVQIAAGAAHTCGVQAGGSLWCWGDAGYGQLGNGSTSPDESEPVLVLPNSFTFNDVGGADHNTLTTSNTITISGIYMPMPVSVSGDGTPEISINGGAWDTSGTISNGQTLAVRLTSANADNTTRSATVTVGSLSDNWSVTTKTLDTTPNAFSFTDVTGANFSTLTTSNTISISGIDSPASVSVSGTGSPEISINGGGWTTSGTITNGQSLAVRLTSAPGGSTARTATVTVGGVSDNWSVTTKPAVVPGSQTFNSSGSFVVPAYNNLTVQVWGAGGGGRGYTSGGNGGYSHFNGIYAYGGNGGTTSPGSGGTASGGTTNQTGGAGNFIKGGDGASGGSGGAAGAAYSPGQGGSAPGGGGGGGSYIDWNTFNSSYLAGGGGGGYASRTYSAGALTVGASMAVTVGGGASGGIYGSDGASESWPGGGGAGGRVTFTWN
jgi:alpha-tubulin suppressor-like RCC1 family protein